MLTLSLGWIEAPRVVRLWIDGSIGKALLPRADRLVGEDPLAGVALAVRVAERRGGMLKGMIEFD